MVKIKRAYEAPSRTDGERVLIDRLWPRGLRRQAASLAEWARDLAPSDALRRWFGHDPARWTDFQRRYRAELRSQRARLEALAARARERTVTLVYSARDEAHNNAVVVKAVLDGLGRARRAAGAPRRRRGAA